MMFLLNAAFMVGISGGINVPNQFKAYDKDEWKTPPDIERNKKSVSGTIGLDLGLHQSWGIFGLFSLASVGYTLGPIAKEEKPSRELKETWFFQAALKPEWQIVKMFSVYGVLSLKAARFSMAEPNEEESLSNNMSIPLGLGICVKPISHLFLTLEGTYNFHFSQHLGSKEPMKIGAPFAVKLGVAYAF